MRRSKAALEERFGDDARAVTEEVCREVEVVAHGSSRHFELEYVADGSLVRDTEPRGWPPPDSGEIQRRAGSVGGPPAGSALALRRETPVSVLVGERTLSSGEGLAYHLQSRRRARIVGEHTPGAAGQRQRPSARPPARGARPRPASRPPR